MLRVSKWLLLQIEFTSFIQVIIIKAHCFVSAELLTYFVLWKNDNGIEWHISYWLSSRYFWPELCFWRNYLMTFGIDSYNHPKFHGNNNGVWTIFDPKIALIYGLATDIFYLFFSLRWINKINPFSNVSIPSFIEIMIDSIVFLPLSS